MLQDIAFKFVGIGTKKIKSFLKGSKKVAGLLGSLAHDLCRHLVPNADMRPAQPNLIACEETGWQLVPLDGTHPKHAMLVEPAYWVARSKTELAKRGIMKWRKDAVRLVQQLAHFSPEVFRGGKLFGDIDADLALKLAADVLAFFREKYPDGVLVFIVHNDEYTPHMGAYILPIKEHPVKLPGRPKKGTSADDRKATEKWTLDAKDIFNPKTCGEIQTSFANFLRARGYDVVRGIAGSRTGFMVMQTLMRFLHSPIPEVPAFVCPEPAMDGVATLNPLEFCRQVVHEAESWHRKVVEEVIPPLHAKALQRDDEFRRCRGYQKTAWEKEEELQKYRVDMDFLKKDLASARQEVVRLREVPRLNDVARRLLGSRRIKSTDGAKTTYRLPDGNELEIDSEEECYRRQLPRPSGHPTIDYAKASGVLEMIADIIGWDAEHARDWVEAQWGTVALAACLIQSASPSATIVAPAPAPETPVPVPSLVMKSEANWPPVRSALVDRYRFTPDLIDDLSRDGRLSANRYSDLLCFSSSPTDGDLPQVYPLKNGVALGDGAFPSPKPFTLGAGAEILIVVDQPLEALGLWEAIPVEMRPTVTVTVAANGDLDIWPDLRERFPRAALCDARAGAKKRITLADTATGLPAPVALAPEPFATWALAWRHQFQNEPSAEVFREVRGRLLGALPKIASPEPPNDDPEPELA